MRKSLFAFLVSISNICISQTSIHSTSRLNFSYDSLNIASMVRPIKQENIFSDPVYNIWCGAVIKGKNSKYYMFYSRWPKVFGHFAWLPASEIALAKADNPEGPYKHVKVILEKRGSNFWDGVCTHNPAVVEFNGVYYLYYMGTTGQSHVNMPASMQDNNWWEYRNNQRIGVAFSEELEGKWTRLDKPILDVSADSLAFDALMVSNPAVAVNEKGNVVLAYKQVAKKPGNIRGGKVRFGVAFANSLLGPFSKHSEPIFQNKDKDNPNIWMMAEDPFMWSSGGKFYAIVTDVVGVFSNNQAALVLLSSWDGINWKPTKYPSVVPHRLKFENGSLADDKLERPWLYFENAIPKVLFGALGFNKRSFSANVAIKLE
ncbi:MAG: hypothetical protein RL638_272 [Bacteroidota bacterium]